MIDTATELTRSLHGIAGNLLSQRLRTLEAAGIVERRLGDAGVLYALTPWGAGLREPIEGLARWGIPLMVTGRGGDAFEPRGLSGRGPTEIPFRLGEPPGRLLTVPESEPTPHPLWCMVANVVPERPLADADGEVARMRGLRLFSPGAKLYVLGAFSGDGGEKIKVVGRCRRGGNRRYVPAIVLRKWLGGWRVRAVYSPAALHRLHQTGPGWFRSPDVDLGDEKRAELEGLACRHSRMARAERASSRWWVEGGFAEVDTDCGVHGAECAGMRLR
ncbi:winged helix-turn-helix transcriptional regulator [Phytomonospora sp. NPDC050363]|uniref:winged helix-turn-helix transcriptional regulator n=1 Tax=Phytomonospora sp. NPDC050363 TaxID=3155642 RepID=UPI0033EB693B